MDAPSWVSPYIGIPFVGRGFDANGCHCWGLVRLVLLRECSVDVPAYAEISAEDLLAIARAGHDALAHDPWCKVEGPWRAFDIVPMTSRRQMIEGRMQHAEGHVGIMISATRLLHVEAATAAVHVPLEHPTVRHRLLFGAYRHTRIANSE